MRIIVLLGQELYGVGRDKEKQNFLQVSCKSQKRWFELPCFLAIEIKWVEKNVARGNMFPDSPDKSARHRLHYKKKYVQNGILFPKYT